MTKIFILKIAENLSKFIQSFLQFIQWIREAAKNWPYPPPLELSGHRSFFLLKKKQILTKKKFWG